MKRVYVPEKEPLTYQNQGNEAISLAVEYEDGTFENVTLKPGEFIFCGAYEVEQEEEAIEEVIKKPKTVDKPNNICEATASRSGKPCKRKKTGRSKYCTYHRGGNK